MTEDLLEEILNVELENVNVWFSCNRLSLNIKKTNLITF